jgi:hypothetical protein
VIKFVSDLRLVGGFLPSTPVSSINKIDRHDIAEILLQVALNTIKPNQPVIYDHVYILGKPNTRHLFLCARQGNIFGAHGFFFLEYYKQSTLERCSGIIYIQHFVLDPHADMDFYSASSLKQQSTGRHVAPLGHNYFDFEQPKKK